jgi:hypothetical protein
LGKKGYKMDSGLLFTITVALLWIIMFSYGSTGITKDNLNPRLGEKRIISKFLWLPKLADSKWKWLEMATWEEIYKSEIDPGGPPVCGWEETRWID